MPVLSIPALKGIMSEVYLIMREVFMAFKVQGVNDYFNHELICKKILNWSQVCVATVAQSIIHNGKLRHFTIDVAKSNSSRYYNTPISIISNTGRKKEHHEH